MTLNRNRLRLAAALPILFVACGYCYGDSVPIGVLSLDVFIPASGTPGVNALDIFNYTGPTYGPALGSPYVSSSVTLDNLSLTVFLLGGGSQTFTPGNLNPGELVDSMGNPVIQFSSTTNITSALLTATLSSTTLTLSNGSAFNALPPISVDLTPSSGSTLSAGLDLVLIEAESSTTASSPEPASLGLSILGLVLIVRSRKHSL